MVMTSLCSKFRTKTQEMDVVTAVSVDTSADHVRVVGRNYGQTLVKFIFIEASFQSVHDTY